MADELVWKLKIDADSSEAEAALKKLEEKAKTIKIGADAGGSSELTATLKQTNSLLQQISSKLSGRAISADSGLAAKASMAKSASNDISDEAISSLASKGGSGAGGKAAAAAAIARIAKSFLDQMKKVFDALSGYFKDQFMSAFKELTSTSGMGSFATSTSLFANAAARQQQMIFGLSEAQNYGLTLGMQTLGMSREDLYWMNDNQKNMLNELSNRFAAQFDRLNNSGGLLAMQQAAIDFAVFKQDMKINFMQFIIDNKDLIISSIKLGMKLLEGIMKAVLKIFNFFAGVFGGEKINENEFLKETEKGNGANSIDNSISSNPTITVNVYGNADGQQIANEIEKSYRTAMIKRWQ